MYLCMWKDSVFGTTRMWVTTTERVWERIRHTVTRTQIIIKKNNIFMCFLVIEVHSTIESYFSFS